ncbi:MAG TPA: hypothetical protein VJ866_19465 [Pyrinomonadaceae bacterium]|nr:hypothetical protein [Pyrinomonadaceae bacterium]
MNRLKNFEAAEDARRALAAMLGACPLWFLRERRDGRAIELRRGDWELCVAGGALAFSYWGESGRRVWRVNAWSAEGDTLMLEASRRMGAERARLWLVPRALVATARETVADARRAECERLASLISTFSGARVERASLSVGARRGEPGRWARIILRTNDGISRVVGMRQSSGRIAVTGPVVPADAEAAESLLASALLWLSRLDEGARVGELWLVARRPLAAALAERVPLLHEDLRSRTSVFELDEEGTAPARISIPTLSELLDAPAPRLPRPRADASSELAASVVALAPEQIDVVRARRGETLRFNGLPFARVRRLYGREQLWFGVESAPRRTPLDEESAHAFLKLVAELREHRRADARGSGHALYRAAPEAWLESLLRRDITRLDPGLRLAPLHAQFRAPHAAGGARPVDLLALRRDGRLVVIELKVSEDAALALQGADYWRRVEAQRRRGDIERARLFGDASITDEPPLVYLVAPMLRFHRSFQVLARAVTPRVELYRVDLNEDWRAGVRVVRLARVA